MRTGKIAFGLVVLAAGLARAQQAGPQDGKAAQEPGKETTKVDVPPPERVLTVSLHVSGEFGFESNLTDSPGKIAVTRAAGQVEVGIPLGQYASLDLGLNYEHSSFDFHNATGFVAGSSSPFSDVDRAAVTARFIQPLSQEWAVFVGGAVISSAEDGAKSGDGFGAVLYGAPRYVVNKHLAVGLGALMQTRLEDNITVVPLVLIDWDISEHWNLTHDGFPGGTLTYKPNEHWAFSLSAYYEFEDFRLAENGPLPNGVGRQTRIPVVLSAAWRPDSRIEAEAGVGVAFGQNYELLNSNGDSVADIDADAAPMLRLKVGIKF